MDDRNLCSHVTVRVQGIKDGPKKSLTLAPETGRTVATIFERVVTK